MRGKEYMHAPRNWQLMPHLPSDRDLARFANFNRKLPSSPIPLDHPTAAQTAKRKTRITLAKVWEDR